jgi:replicative DNA helicase
MTLLGSPSAATAARILPHDHEAEQSVLGALMLDQNAVSVVRDILLAEDFYEERHQAIFRACVELNDRGEAIDVITLRNQLDRQQALARSGGIDYLSDLSNAVPTAASVRYYADIVIEHSTRRRLVRVGQEIADLGLDETMRADQATDLAEQRVFAVAQQRRSDDAVHIAPLLHDTWSQLEQALGERRIITGVATNFNDLDKKTQGLQPGELVILAARPSVGKTSFALNIARNAAVLAEEPTVIFSLEMSREALVQRLLCSEARVDSFLLRTGQARPEDFQKIAKALDKLHRADIWIDDTPGLSIAQLRARARRMKAQHAIKLIIVDYLQLMHGGRQESRVQEVSDISAGLKGIAKELQLPVLALSQLSRESERRQDRTPQLSDLRDSGSIEQDADVVLFLFRPGMHDRERDASETKLLVAKNRNGPIGDIDLVFNAEQTSFREPYRGRAD